MNKTIIPKPVRTQELTDARKLALLKDVQFIGTIVQLLENRWRQNLFDVNLRDPAMKNCSRQIYLSTQRFKKELTTKFRLKEPDELKYEMAAEMDRVVEFFCLLPSSTVGEIMDQLEAEYKEWKESKNNSNQIEN